MNLLRTQTTKGLAANGTKVRLLSGMSPEMLRKAVFELELHAALFADIFHLVQLGVIVQILLALESLSAGGTFELLDLRLVFVMLVKV